MEIPSKEDQQDFIKRYKKDKMTEKITAAEYVKIDIGKDWYINI